ncbi:unnamed protein product [Gongylonema pulchrum]|uniref:Uncharacterized protein n=1 Tax=Gongylonema pulchrum TaxID=637853 RepID=A0A183DE17_9BILA|nr:unnamed protein product [Gongylonema pulchrum]
MQVPQHSEQVERLECREVVEFTYKAITIKKMLPSLNICDKLSVRMDERGILSIQFMIEQTENAHTFLEFYVSSINFYAFLLLL